MKQTLQAQTLRRKVMVTLPRDEGGDSGERTPDEEQGLEWRGD